MKKLFIKTTVILAMIILCISLVACAKISLPKGSYECKQDFAEMKVSDDGNFKILQVSDFHLVGGKNEDDSKTLKAMDKTLKANKYDLVIITGDLFEGFTSRSYDKSSAVASVINLFEGNNQPFTLVMGNNDGEYLGSLQDIVSLLIKSPMFIFAEAQNVGGVGNFYIKLLDGQNIEKHRLVLLDTRMRDNVGVYIHMDESQTNYYNKIAAECKALGIKLSLFTHIPFNNLGSVVFDGKSLSGDLGVNDMEMFYSNTNNSQPMFDAIVNSQVCGLIASGHMHSIDVAREVDGIYYKITRAAGYYCKLPKGATYGGAVISLNTNGADNTQIYTFENINF